LKSVLDNDKAFDKIVDKLAEDKDETDVTDDPLFEDILNKVMEHLKDSPEKFDAVLDFSRVKRQRLSIATPKFWTLFSMTIRHSKR
jgi:hypothetical protein